jgi:hypothetical protein
MVESAICGNRIFQAIDYTVGRSRRRGDDYVGLQRAECNLAEAEAGELTASGVRRGQSPGIAGIGRTQNA